MIQGVFGLIFSLFLEVRDDVFSFTILTMVSCRELKVSSLLLGSENQGSQLNLLRDSFIASMLGSLDVELLNFFLGKGGFLAEFEITDIMGWWSLILVFITWDSIA